MNLKLQTCSWILIIVVGTLLEVQSPLSQEKSSSWVTSRKSIVYAKQFNLLPICNLGDGSLNFLH